MRKGIKLTLMKEKLRFFLLSNLLLLRCDFLVLWSVKLIFAIWCALPTGRHKMNIQKTNDEKEQKTSSFLKCQVEQNGFLRKTEMNKWKINE